MNESSIIELLQKLVRQASFSGQEGGAIALAAEAMRALGFDEVGCDETGNLIGAIHGRLPGPRVIFDAHIDVVTATTPEAWRFPPFSATLSEGAVWGRGAADNKGSLAAMICALARIERASLHGTRYVVASVGEEIYEGIGLAQAADALQPDRVIIGEPTGCNLGYGQRGRARLLFRVRGQAAHSSADDQSGNAVYRLAPLLERLQRQPLPQEDAIGTGIQAPIQVISSPYPSTSIVPDEILLTVDRRLMRGESEESVLGECRALLADLPGVTVAMDVVTYTSYTGKSFTLSDFHPAWLTGKDSELVQSCADALRGVGIQPALVAIPYCTNASYTAGVRGVPAVVFGPGDIRQAHAVDEHLAVEELLRAARGYAALAQVVM